MKVNTFYLLSSITPFAAVRLGSSPLREFVLLTETFSYLSAGFTYM